MKEVNEDDFRESIIERTGLTNEFTVASIEKHLATLGKLRIEGEGTMGLAQATADNVLRSNEWIKDMSEEDQHALWMYYDNITIANEIKPQLEDVYTDEKIHNEYLDVIYDKFGFVKTELPDVTDTEDGVKA